MKRIKIKAFMTVLLVTVGSSSNMARDQLVHHELQLSDTGHGLRLSIQLDAKVYNLHDVGSLTITLTNVGGTPISVYRKFGWGRSSSFLLSIADANGKPIERTMLPDAHHSPPFSVEDFASIKPGESIRLERDLDVEGEEIKEPGVYTIRVWYHSPIPRRFAPHGMNVWTKENGVLRANALSFRVE